MFSCNFCQSLLSVKYKDLSYLGQMEFKHHHFICKHSLFFWNILFDVNRDSRSPINFIDPTFTNHTSIWIDWRNKMNSMFYVVLYFGGCISILGVPHCSGYILSLLLLEFFKDRSVYYLNQQSLGCFLNVYSWILPHSWKPKSLEPVAQSRK